MQQIHLYEESQKCPFRPTINKNYSTQNFLNESEFPNTSRSKNSYKDNFYYPYLLEYFTPINSNNAYQSIEYPNCNYFNKKLNKLSKYNSKKQKIFNINETNGYPMRNYGNLLGFNDLNNENENLYGNNSFRSYCNTNANYHFRKNNIADYPCLNYLTNRKNNIPKKNNPLNNTCYSFYNNKQSKKEPLTQENNKIYNYSSINNRNSCPLNNKKIDTNNNFNINNKQKRKISNKKIQYDNYSSNNFEILRNLDNLTPQINSCALFSSTKNSNFNTNKKSNKKLNSANTKSNTNNNNFSSANSNKVMDNVLNKSNELFYSFAPGNISNSNITLVNNKQNNNNSNSMNSYINPSTLSQTAKNFCVIKNSGSSFLEDDKKHLQFKKNLEIAQNEINEYFNNDSMIKANKNEGRRNTPQSLQSIQSLSDSQIFELANHYITEDDSVDNYTMNNIIYNKKKRVKSANNLTNNNKNNISNIKGKKSKKESKISVRDKIQRNNVSKNGQNNRKK